jgi:transposase
MDRRIDGCGDGWRSGFAGRIEVRESRTGRREWPEAVKGRIVRESLEAGVAVKAVALRHGIAPQQLTTWRRMARQGRLALADGPASDDGFGFAALVVTEAPTPKAVIGASPATTAAIEIVSGEVVVRLAGATPAARIAEIAAALGRRR